MTSLARTAAIVAVLACVGACSSGGGDASNATAVRACTAERHTMQAAITAYTDAWGNPPLSTRDLLSAEMIPRDPRYWTVAPGPRVERIGTDRLSARACNLTTRGHISTAG